MTTTIFVILFRHQQAPPATFITLLRQAARVRGVTKIKNFNVLEMQLEDCHYRSEMTAWCASDDDRHVVASRHFS